MGLSITLDETSFDHPHGRAFVPLTRIAICLLTIVLLARSVAGAETRPPALRPYAVCVELRWEDSSLLTRGARKAVLADVQAICERTLGQHWAPKFREVEVACALSTLSRWTAKELPAEAVDKHFVIGIAEQGGGFDVMGFEWDTTVALQSRRGRAFAADLDLLAHAIWLVVQDVYRPLAEIQRSRSGENRLAPWGAGLVPPDARWRPLRAGEYWEPVNLHLDEDAKVQRIQPVPWTYLKLGKADGLDAAIEVISGIRSPIPTRRKRIRPVALRVAPGQAGTRITLRNRSAHSRPMAGLEVRVARVEKEPPEVLVTNRLGVVTVPVASDPDPVWVTVYSGQELLARVPFISGLRSDEMLDLPDDSIRLKVEGELTLLQADLVDTVARRATILATARKRAKEGNVEAVETSLTQIKELKTTEIFTSELASIRLLGIQAARSRKNRAAELRIVKMCDDASAVVSAYMSPDKQKQLEEELADLREVATENRDGLKFIQKNSNAASKSEAPQPAVTAPAATKTPAPPKKVSAPQSGTPKPAPRPPTGF